MFRQKLRKPEPTMKYLITAVVMLFLVFAFGYGEFDSPESEKSEPLFFARLEVADEEEIEYTLRPGELDGAWTLVNDELAKQVAESSEKTDAEMNKIPAPLNITLRRPGGGVHPTLILECRDQVLEFKTLQLANKITVLPPDKSGLAWIEVMKDEERLYGGPIAILGIIRDKSASKQLPLPSTVPTLRKKSEPAKPKNKKEVVPEPNGIRLMAKQ
jgi:hypothetical protein